MKFIYRFYFCMGHWRRFIRAPVTCGSRILVVSEGRVLLVRLTYTRGWCLPGGGVDRDESFVEAAARELKEECGLESAALELFGLYFNRRDRRLDHVAVYLVREFTGELKAADPREIAEVKMFALNALPENLWPGHRRRIEEFLQLRQMSSEW